MNQHVIELKESKLAAEILRVSIDIYPRINMPLPLNISSDNSVKHKFS
jgi:hypothetical protein